jgi:hypothetical protein
MRHPLWTATDNRLILSIFVCMQGLDEGVDSVMGVRLIIRTDVHKIAFHDSNRQVRMDPSSESQPAEQSSRATSGMRRLNGTLPHRISSLLNIVD